MLCYQLKFTLVICFFFSIFFINLENNIKKENNIKEENSIREKTLLNRNPPLEPIQIGFCFKNRSSSLI